MDKSALMLRRLENLDAAILYFSKRISVFRRQRTKVVADASLPSGLLSTDSVSEVILLDLEIRSLEDVVSYLKLC